MPFHHSSNTKGISRGVMNTKLDMKTTQRVGRSNDLLEVKREGSLATLTDSNACPLVHHFGSD